MPDRARKGRIPTGFGDSPPDKGPGGEATQSATGPPDRYARVGAPPYSRTDEEFRILERQLAAARGRAEVGAPPTISTSTALIRGYLARKREALEAFAAEARALGCEVTITDLIHVDGPDDPAPTDDEVIEKAADRARRFGFLPSPGSAYLPKTGVRIETTPDEVAELHRLLTWVGLHPTAAGGWFTTGQGALCRIPADLAPVAARWQACLDRWIGEHEPVGRADATND